MLRTATVALLGLFFTAAAIAASSDIPTGRLSGTIKPTAYRINLTVDPAAKDFSGHTEIDATLAQATRTIFLHGNGLRVSKAQVMAGKTPLTAKYTEVHESGVARLDLPSDVPAGKLTLTFDYAADFRVGAEGLFHAEVAGDWYAWTQMEPIDARRMFPSFDEPGFKTPFTITITAPKSAKVFANTPEVGATPAGDKITHRFAPTQPLPTYLVAIGVGPFEVIEGVIPPNKVRTHPVPWRVIATKGQKARMQLAAAESPKLVALVEQYVGIPYPFEKLDLLGTPILGGAMENAGLIIQDDTLMLLDPDAPLSQLRGFAEVTAHEIAHQWFGDLVTPDWWTDIWLNEAFASWLGKKVGDQWRPDLGIAASETEDALDAMDTDSLGKGRPIHQEITENRQIMSAFDSITYLKGGQVLSMLESYLGTEKFAQGVHKHLERYKHGNATADDFFRSLGEAAGDPKIVASLKTFTDQTGVPVVTVSQNAQGISVSQARYRPLGIAAMPAQTWKIPLCLRVADSRSCSLLESQTATLPAIKGTGALIPNAAGAGYYRFRLDAANRDRVIAAATTLPAREALAVADSLWADFAAGTGSFEHVLAAARALSAHKERLAAVELGSRLKALADTTFTPEQIVQYRKVMQSMYGPRLAALGSDLRPGAYQKDPVDKQALRQALVPFVALEGRDPELRSRLAAAAEAALNGDARAIDPAYRSIAFSVAVQDRGTPFITKLRDALVKSTDPLFRLHASSGLASAENAATADATLGLAFSNGVQSMESLQIVLATSRQPGARDAVIGFVDKNFEQVMNAFPGFAKPYIVRMFDGKCGADDVAKLEAYMKPKMPKIGGGDLELAQTKERIGQCVALKNAKGAEIGTALAKAAT